jgi:hypothetical protein
MPSRVDSGLCGDSGATALETLVGRALDCVPLGLRSTAMQFVRIISPVEDIEIWNASSNGFSFVISYESRTGPGFHGKTGFVASWRPIHQNRGAIKIGGSPFKTLAEAEEACKAMLGHLRSL